MKSFWFATAVLTLLTEGAPAHAQFGGVVFDPTQSAHAIEQIAQGEQIFTNTVTLAKNAIATYNLAYQMSLAPQSPLRSISLAFYLLDAVESGSQHIRQLPAAHGYGQQRFERAIFLPIGEYSANWDRCPGIPRPSALRVSSRLPRKVLPPI